MNHQPSAKIYVLAVLPLPYGKKSLEISPKGFAHQDDGVKRKLTTLARLFLTELNVPG